MTDRWRITYDDGNLDDEYDERPSEFLIRQTQYACPDTPIKVWRLIDGWNPELVDERAPLT